MTYNHQPRPSHDQVPRAHISPEQQWRMSLPMRWQLAEYIAPGAVRRLFETRAARAEEEIQQSIHETAVAGTDAKFAELVAARQRRDDPMDIERLRLQVDIHARHASDIFHGDLQRATDHVSNLRR